MTPAIRGPPKSALQALPALCVAAVRSIDFQAEEMPLEGMEARKTVNSPVMGIGPRPWRWGGAHPRRFAGVSPSDRDKLKLWPLILLVLKGARRP
jgi:hypothetical protein